MGTHRLSPDEAALWARVMAGVRPLREVAPVNHDAGVQPAKAPPSKGGPAAPPRSAPSPSALKLQARAPVVPRPARPVPKRATAAPANTLDGTWDRQLSRGLVSPDRTVDLHGHTLHSAHDLLDAALAAAIRSGDRTILLITGKPPRPASERPHARGAIRAATGDWLAGSRHAASIAAVRAAHPRHGGAGALYIVLRRPRAMHTNSPKS